VRHTLIGEKGSVPTGLLELVGEENAVIAEGIDGADDNAGGREVR
jgi:hypothetical protein